MNASSKSRLVEKLKNKRYRDAYVASHINTGVAWQVRIIRESRKWTQSELGDKADIRQNAISRLEDPDYGRLTISTLLKLASAFDVALMIKFVPFSRLIDETKDLSPKALNAKSFEEDLRELEEATTELQKSVSTNPDSSTHRAEFKLISGTDQPASQLRFNFDPLCLVTTSKTQNEAIYQRPVISTRSKELTMLKSSNV